MNGKNVQYGSIISLSPSDLGKCKVNHQDTYSQAEGTWYRADFKKKKSRPDLLVQRLCKVKGCNDPHLTLLIFSSCRQPKNVLLTLINNSLPERPDTDLTFSPLAFICSGMAFLTFALFRQNLDLISNNLLKTAVYLSSMPAVFFPLFTLPFCLEKEAAVCSVPW